MKLSILAGATGQSVNVFIQDSSSITGAGLTGLLFNSAGLSASYSFTGANAGRVAITLATLAAVNSAYSSGGFKEIDATNMPGWYRLDLPNAALATSKGRCSSVHLFGATNMAPCPLEIELTAVDNQSAIAFMTSVATVTNLTNAPTNGDLTATMKASVATAALTTAMTESYAADGATPTLAQMQYMMWSYMAEMSISGVTGTANKLDGSTPAMTFTFNSATVPTAVTRAT